MIEYLIKIEEVYISFRIFIDQIMNYEDHLRVLSSKIQNPVSNSSLAIFYTLAIQLGNSIFAKLYFESIT